MIQDVALVTERSVRVMKRQSFIYDLVTGINSN